MGERETLQAVFITAERLPGEKVRLSLHADGDERRLFHVTMTRGQARDMCASVGIAIGAGEPE